MTVLVSIPRAILLAGAVSTVAASPGPFVALEPAPDRSLVFAGFELQRKTELRIDAVGLAAEGGAALPLFSVDWPGEDEGESAFAVYGWLLDATSRKPVWTMERDATTPHGGRGRLRAAAAALALPAGRYELYLYSGIEARAAERDAGWIDRTLDYFSGSEPRQLVASCRIALALVDPAAERPRTFEVTGDLPGAIVRLNRVGDSELRSAGLAVRQPATVRVYGLGEQGRGTEAPADFGWLVERKTRRVVWKSWRAATKPAGGSRKNRLIDEELRLPPGDYVLYYGTDDSHAFPRFNAASPHDPLNWGLTLVPGAGQPAEACAPLTVVEPEPLIELREVGDRAALERRFRLARAATLHVRALGEWADGSFADGAAILDAATGREVWTMTEATTMPGGGATKNRRFDGLVALPAGRYRLTYRTDGSHSYGQWNSAAPIDPRSWGVSLRAAPGAAPPGLVLESGAQ